MTFIATDDSSNRQLNVLVVDDTDIVRTTILRMLAGRGYRVSEASTGEDALALLATVPVDLLVSDLRLGEGISGAELIAKATILQPRAKMILMSGSILTRPGQKLSYPVLAKPFREAELMELVSGLLRSN